MYPLGCELPFFYINNAELRNEIGNERMSYSVYSKMYFSPNEISDSFTDMYDPALNCLCNNECLYYDIEQINNISSHCNSLVSTLFLNIRSIPKNFEEFDNDFNISLMKYDMLLFAETRLMDDLNDLYRIQGYNLYSNPRNTAGGGVAMYIRENFIVSLIEDFLISNEILESIFVQFSLNSNRYIVGCVYRPPSGNIGDFLIMYSDLLSKIKLMFSSYKIYIYGDFNINIFNFNNDKFVLDYIALMFSNNYSPLILRPTRVCNTSATLIDHIWTNDGNVPVSGIILSDISDHFTLLCNIVVNDSSDRNDVYVEYSSRLKYDRVKDSIMCDINNYDWVSLCSNVDIEQCYTIFNDAIRAIYDKHCAIIVKRVKRLDVMKPYISNEIKCMLREKHRLQKLFHRRPISYGEKFRAFRNKLNDKIRKARSNYYKDKLTNIEGDCRGTWGVLNSLMGRGNRPSQCSEFEENGSHVSSPNAIANGFNNYFSGIGASLLDGFESENDDFINYLPPETECLLRFNAVSSEDTRSVIFSIKNSAPGYDDIPILLFKDNINRLLTIITHICNLSICHGIFPQKLKIAKITCVYKSGDKKLFSNYRPISVLPAFSKIIEKIVANKLYDHLESNRLLTDMQFGFRRVLSTVDAVQHLTDTLYDCFDEGDVAVGAFIDLTKAFDTLDRNKLLIKLERYGVKGRELNWFKSYFNDRHQYVRYGNVESQLKPINVGTPQGSIVGPLTFIIFINDIVRCSNMVKFVLFADDTSVVCKAKTAREAVMTMNNELCNVNKWFHANCLTINEHKSSFIIFHRWKNKINDNIPNLTINGGNIERVQYTKFLGVILDSNVTWAHHVTNLTRKLSKFIPILYKIRCNLDSKALKLVYNALIYPNLMYCNALWGSCSTIHLNSLIIFQKKIIRVISCKPDRFHTSPLFVELYLLNLSQINHFSCINRTFKSLQMGSTWTTLYASPYVTRSSNAPTLTLPAIMTAHSRQSVRWRGIKFFNELPELLRNIKNFDTFKKNVKLFLITGELRGSVGPGVEV